MLWISFEKKSLRLLLCSAPTIPTLWFATPIVLCSLDLANFQSSKNLGPWDGPSLHAGPRGQGRCRKGLVEWPWQTLGFQLSAPGSGLVYHGRNSCSFHPPVRSEGLWEVSTLWGGMAPALY